MDGKDNMDPGIRAGDKIEYFDGSPDYSTERLGHTGMVVEVIKDRANVEWDDGYKSASRWNVRNLRRLVTQADIDAALRVLNSAGEVSFVPHKPPFAAIKLGRIGGYEASVSEKAVKVGCTSVTFERFDEIAAAVAKAREYNAS